MTEPVSYLELNSPDLDRSSAFFSTVFGWELRPFAAPNYLVASLDDARRRVVEHGGTVVVEPFVVQGVGRGCYFTDPAGVLTALVRPWHPAMWQSALDAAMGE
jgi:uncharacterized protein